MFVTLLGILISVILHNIPISGLFINIGYKSSVPSPVTTAPNLVTGPSKVITYLSPTFSFDSIVGPAYGTCCPNTEITFSKS